MTKGKFDFLRGYTPEAKASFLATVRTEAEDEAAGRCTLCRVDHTADRSKGSASCSLTGSEPWDGRGCPAIRR